MKKQFTLSIISILVLLTLNFLQAFGNKSNFSTSTKGLFFRENKGQVRDQNFKPRQDVLFSGSTGNFGFYLKNDGLHYQLSKVDSWKKSNQATVFESEEHKLVPDLVSIYRVDVNWKGANKNATIEKGKALEGYDNFYNVPEGIEPALFVKSYTSITYKNIYEGIDLKFYESKTGELEYDFIVQPNEDLRQIAIEIKGAELSVNEKQELIIKTPLGEIVEGALAIYQEEKKIAGNWIVEGEIVRFDVTGSYDHSKPLRIDPPVRVWGTYAGTKIFDNTSFDVGLSCSSDPTGNIFMAGQLYSGLGSTLTSNIASTGAHQTTVSVNTAFLMKLDANGVRLWGTFYGTSGDDYGTACAADASGNVFLAGSSTGSTGIATTGSHQPNKDISTDAYLVKFNSAGVRQWGTYFGKEYGEEATSVAVDNNGDVYLAGTGGPSVNFGTPGTHQQTGAGGTEAFLAKFNTNGTRLWCTMFGGPLQEETSGCTTDANGNVYLNGRTKSASGIASVGAAQTVYGGGDDMFIAKFNANGVRQWSTYLGGPNDEGQYDGDAKPSVDANGNVYICGTTYAPTGINPAISTPGAYQSTYGGGGSDAFLAKWNASGALQWATYYGGSGLDYGFATSIDASGNVYFAGQSFSGSGISTAGVHQSTLSGSNDAILVKFLPNGQRDWGTYFGGLGTEDKAWNLTVHKPSGALYLCGQTWSTTNIATTGAHQTVFAGGYSDAFLAKFIDCPPAGNLIPTTNAPLCVGQNLTLNVPSISGATYTWSGPNGFTSSLANPTISNATANASGIYNVTVTANGCPGSTGSIQVTVTPTPAEPIAQSVTPTFCKDSTATYQVTSTGTLFNWYSSQTGGSFLGSGTIYTSGPLQVNTYVYVERVENGCSSARTDVFAKVIITQDPAPVNTQICSGNSTTINSNISSGTSVVKWYNSQSAITEIFTGQTYTTPSLTSNTTYYVQNFENGCPSASVPVTVTVITPPVSPTVSGTTICSGQTATLNATAPNGATFAWYTAASGGTALFTGNPYPTPALNSNTTYYVESQAGSCSNARTAVTVIVNPSPSSPIATTLTPGVCKDSSASFEVTSTGTIFNWYATATSTSILGTGTIFTSAALQNSTSFFVERIENNCPSSRTQVFVQVIIAPNPTPANTQICDGTSTTINSNISNAFTVNWYDAAIATTPIFVGANYTTPVLNSNTTYYAQTEVNGCPSARVSVTITVINPPVAPIVSDTTICSGQSTSLTATAPSGVTLAWFTTASGGTAIFSGNPFNTAALNANTTYYAESQIGNCVSTSRTEVMVSVDPTPLAPIASAASICSGQAATLIVNAAPGVDINWYSLASGGISISNSDTFTTPNLANNSTYYTDATLGNCISPRTAVTVTVNNPPAAPTVNGQTICEGGSAVLNATAPAGATFNWYDAVTGGNLLQTASNFTTPTLSANTTYFVESFNGCTSGRTAVLVTVNTPPAQPIVSGSTICSGQNTTPTAATVSGVTFSWFDAAVNGTLLQSGASFSTPILNNTTTYYVESAVAACPPSLRTAVTVIVEPTPSAPTSNNVTICNGETATLNASAPSSVTLNWYASQTGGASLGNSSNFTTPVLSTSTIYYVDASLGNCSSGRTAVTITINNPPQSPTAINETICEGQNTTLNANASGATINWYDAVTAGNFLFSGNTFTTPVLNSNTTYYVEAVSGGCPPTSRIAVTVTVLTTPPNPSVSSASVCSGESATISAIGANGTTLIWYDAPISGNQLSVGSSFTTPVLTGNTTYYVAAQLGNCSSSNRVPITVNVIQTPNVSFTSNPDKSTTLMVSLAEFTFSNNTKDGSRFVWYFGDGDSLETNSTINVSHKYNQPGEYTVRLCAYNEGDCSDCFEYGKYKVVEDYAIYIPNAFSPNGDGNNDLFEYYLVGVKSVSIRIFNKWGEKVFETNNPNSYWDGSYKGQALNPDVFTYEIAVESYAKKREQFMGSLTLIR
jgi:gliding motility-associated-like protein